VARAVAGHPLIAAAVAVVVVGGGGAVASVALSGSSGSGSGPAASSPVAGVVHGFKMVLPLGGAEPVGYDFSRTPPVVADLNGQAIYVSGNQLASTSGQLAAWDGGGAAAVPTDAQCREVLGRSSAREVNIWVGRVVCYIDKNNNPGFIKVTGISGVSVLVDTADLR
jgi:hypothetical protein